MDLTLPREFAELTREKKSIEARLKTVKARLAEIDPQIMELLAQEGVPSIKVTIDEFHTDDLTGQTIEELLDFVDADARAEFDVDACVTRLRRRGLLAESHDAKTVTLYIGSRIWASPVIDDPNRDKANDDEYARACDALEANGYGEFSQRRFNVVSLSSAVKELVENQEIILEGNEGVAFDGTVKVIEKFQVNARGA